MLEISLNRNDPFPVDTGQTIELPPPTVRGDSSIEELLHKRRSIRDYRPESLSLREVAQLLWAAQGITEPNRGKRTAPSAGALFPLELSLAVGDVDDLARGIYRYRPRDHSLLMVADRDVRHELGVAALEQHWMADAAAVIAIAAIYQRTTQKYGDRGYQYVHIDVGHAGQNIYLQAGALGIGTVIVGAFRDREVQELLMLKAVEIPMCLMPVGKA